MRKKRQVRELWLFRRPSKQDNNKTRKKNLTGNTGEGTWNEKKAEAPVQTWESGRISARISPRRVATCAACSAALMALPSRNSPSWTPFPTSSNRQRPDDHESRCPRRGRGRGGGRGGGTGRTGIGGEQGEPEGGFLPESAEMAADHETGDEICTSAPSRNRGGRTPSTG